VTLSTFSKPGLRITAVYSSFGQWTQAAHWTNYRPQRIERMQLVNKLWYEAQQSWPRSSPQHGDTWKFNPLEFRGNYIVPHRII